MVFHQNYLITCLESILTEGRLIGGVLSGGPGLLDPCEKEPVDAVVSLSVQQREDITRSAQVFNYISLPLIGGVVVQWVERLLDL